MIPPLFAALGNDFISSFEPQMKAIVTDPNWRVRLGMLESIAKVSLNVNYYLFVQNFEPLFMFYLTDRISSVRLTGAKLVEVLL